MRVTITVESQALGDTEHTLRPDFLQHGKEREILDEILHEATKTIRRTYQLDHLTD